MDPRYAMDSAMCSMDICSSPPPELSSFSSNFPTEFPLFSLLPLELRLQIYAEHLLLTPRVLSIKSTPFSTLHCSSPHPALLSMNRESRAETLKSYFAIRDLEGQQRFYFHPQLDTVHLTSSTKYSAESQASSTSIPQDEWLFSLSQISSSLPPTLGIYSLALRGVQTLPPAAMFFESGGAKVREMLMLVGPGGHRRGSSAYCGVTVGFMRKMMVREVERSLELMEGGFETGRAPLLLALVGGGEGDEGLEDRLLEERGEGLLVL